ncbi:hypothetical protein QJS10_CPA08g01575 [Acorus calamus]|uniref:Uncharacterized protein n=1 Tax=Acorus calamus TaxID=4465 RepID=A0AAV9EAG0_ACOCL|nr:hypothetical protein QJS10_CPA08g01575 [Acorus calamus]
MPLHHPTPPLHLPNPCLPRHYLSNEASFYGLDHLLRSSLFGVSSSDLTIPRERGCAQQSILHSATVYTHLDEISSLRCVRPDFTAIASPDSPSLHFYSLYGGRHAGSAQWSGPSDPIVHTRRWWSSLLSTMTPSILTKMEHSHTNWPEIGSHGSMKKTDEEFFLNFLLSRD